MVTFNLKKSNKELLISIKHEIQNYFRANNISCLVKISDNFRSLKIEGDLDDSQKINIKNIIDRKKFKDNYNLDLAA